LHSLELKLGHNSDGYASLRALRSSLRRLALSFGMDLPACLPELTGLEALSIEGMWPVGDGGQEASTGDLVVAALPQLTRLTYLGLTPLPGMEQPPVALAGATSLRRFHWGQLAQFEGHSDEMDATDMQASLPKGPWLAGLECLFATPHVLANSLPALQSTSRLQTLGVFYTSFIAGFQRPAGYQQQLATVLHWAASHHTLRHVLVDAEADQFALISNDVCAAQQRNPRLTIEVGGAVMFASPLYDECVEPFS